MKHKFVIGIDGSGADEAIKVVQDYKQWIIQKTGELARRLAEMGATSAEVGFAAAYYDGDNDVSVTTEQRGESVHAVIATGAATLFIEFGSGLIGYGHPEPHGYGPGTFPPTDPSHPRWNQPTGWYMPGGGHTHGNPPNAPMYNSVKELEREIEAIAREVFSD